MRLLSLGIALALAANPCGVLGLLAGELNETVSLGEVLSKKNEPFELKITRQVSKYRVSVHSTGAKGREVGFLLFEETNGGKQVFLKEARIQEDFQNHGLTSKVLAELRTRVPSGTTLRLRSTNIETNNRVHAMVTALVTERPRPGTSRKQVAATQTERVNLELTRLFTDGPKDELPLWARSLGAAGWTGVKIEIQEDGKTFFEATAP